MLKSSADIPQHLVTGLNTVVRWLRAYHRHQVIGLEHIPKDGGAILAVNHSFATYDIALLHGAIYGNSGRIIRSLGDHLLFDIPKLGESLEQLGVAEGTPENAEALIKAGEIVGVAPGGMREALKPSSDRYRTFWDRRRGFVRLAIKMQVPIILAVCPRADDIFHVYENPVTPWVYRRFRKPLPIVRGLGLSLLPRPVKLMHLVGSPIRPPAYNPDPAAALKSEKSLHRRVQQEVQKLIGRAIAYREKSGDS